MSAFTDRVDATLKNHGIAKMAFYKDCGITASAYSLWKSGKTTPTQNNVNTIACYLHVSPAWLEYGVENKNTAESVDSAVQDDMQLMREKIANLSQDQLAVLLQEIAKKLGEG